MDLNHCCALESFTTKSALLTAARPKPSGTCNSTHVSKRWCLMAVHVTVVEYL